MKMNKSAFTSRLKQSIVHSLRRPLFLITAVLYNAACALYYFFGTGFFSGSGSSDLRMFFTAIPYVSILVVPLISFRAEDTPFARTLPLSAFEHTAVSFLTSLAQFCIMSISLLIVPAVVSMFGDIEAGQIFTGFLLTVLYASSVIALCVLTNVLFNPLVSFILSAAVIALTDFAQTVSALRIFSFAYHFDAASKGIADFRDIVFYVCASCLLLLFSVILDEKKRGKTFSKNEKQRNAAFFLIFIFAFLNSTKYYFRADLTKDKQFTVSKYSVQLLDAVNEPLKITYFRSPALFKMYPQVRDIYEYLAVYVSQNKNMSITLLDPDKGNVANLLDSYGIQSQQIQKGGINRTEYLNVYSAVVIEYLGNTQIIPFVLSADTLEYDLDRCVRTLVTGKKQEVMLLAGNGMTAGKDYSYVIPWLTSQGIGCSTIELQNIYTALQDADAGTVLLVFGSSLLKEEDAAAIESFVLRGGKTLFAVSPYEADIAGDWTITKTGNTALLDMLASWGFSFTPTLAADFSCARITMSSSSDADGRQTDSTHSEQLNYQLWISLLPQTEAKKGMTLFWPSPITIENEKIKPLLLTSAYSWEIDEDENCPQKLFETNPFIVRNMKGSNTKKQQIVGAYLDGEVEGHFVPQKSVHTRIAVIGDQYFADSLMMEYIGGSTGDYRNLDFLTHLILKIEGEDSLAALQNKSAPSTSLYKITGTAAFKTMMIRSLIVVFVLIPCLYAAAYAVLLVSRKSRNEKSYRSLINEKM
jgi:hypothetical protein